MAATAGTDTFAGRIGGDGRDSAHLGAWMDISAQACLDHKTVLAPPKQMSDNETIHQVNAGLAATGTLFRGGGQDQLAMNARSQVANDMFGDNLGQGYNNIKKQQQAPQAAVG